jgi:hypothetical protein
MKLCQEEMEQDRPGRDVAAAAVWVALRVKAEAGWAANSPQVRAGVVYVHNAAVKCLILWENRAIKNAVRIVGQ